MTTTKLELFPNELLLNPNFGGNEIKKVLLGGKGAHLPHSVDVVKLVPTKDDPFMIIRLFFYTNHLAGDQFADVGSVYYFDDQWKLRKISDNASFGVLWTVPKPRERKLGDYNLSLKFVSTSTAIVGDGMGILHILDTGNRNDNVPFSVSFSEEVAGPDQTFYIMDAVTRFNDKGTEEIHALLVSIREVNTCETFLTTIHWVTFLKIDGTWRQEALRQVRTRGCVEYAHLSTDCETILVICERECYFTLNSDFPIPAKNATPKRKIYMWSQTSEDIFVEIPLPSPARMDLIRFEGSDKTIDVSYDDDQLILGEFHGEIDSTMNYSGLEGNIFQFIFSKKEIGLMWPALIKNDVNGEYVETEESFPDDKKCTHYCCMNECALSRTEFGAEAEGMALYRLNGTTNKVTHVVKLDAYFIVTTQRSTQNVPPAFGYFCGNDLCFWRPTDTDEGFSVIHEGTKLDSKKFLMRICEKYIQCSPDLSCMVINCAAPEPFYILKHGNISKLADDPTGFSSENGLIMEYTDSRIFKEDALGMYYVGDKSYLLFRENIIMIMLEDQIIC